MLRSEDTAAAARSARVRVAQALGLVALIAGLIGALGPAERVRTTYSWPPSTLPAETPSRVWYTPLLLVRHEPEVISIDVSCDLPAPLAGAEPGHVLSTARYPQRAGGLAITHTGSQLVVTRGRAVLDRIDLPSDAGADCVRRITIADGRWFVSGGGVERQGLVAAMPTVYGLFSGLDLRSDASFEVDVTTIPHATRASARQIVAWIVAALAAVGALFLVAFERRPAHLGRTASHIARSVRSNAHPADAVVALVLLGWCVIAPVNFDDGWVIQREQMFQTSSGFSAYYSLLAANMPLDYWLEWVHHWLAEASNALIVFRLAVLCVLMGVWALCRWIVAQIDSSSGARHRIGTWTLSCAFLLGALAWGMTTRPEPVTALLVTAVTACTVSFVRRENAGLVALAAALVVLALTAHPTGIVSLAPVVVAAPRLLAWARSHLPAAVTIVSASTALLATLAFVGADLDQRVADADTTQELSGNSRDEIQRYAFLWEEPFGTPLRRAFTALFLLAIIGFVLRRRRERAGLLGLPVTVLAVGLVLLVATPSKWPSHFGALIGLGALALAAESARLRTDGRSKAGGWAWPSLAVGAATLAAVWSWWEREPWNLLDLRTLDWEPTFVSRAGLSQLAVLLPALLLFGAVVVARFRRRRPDVWRVAAWIPVAVAVPTIAFTAGVLVVDAAKTSSWTLTRQNLSSLTGDAGCGLADDVLISSKRSSQALVPVGDGRLAPPSWVPSAPVEGLPRYALGPARADSSSSPWFELPSGRRVGLFVAGVLGSTDMLSVEWGRSRAGRTEVIGGGEITEVVSEESGNAPWRFFAAGDLPQPHPDATTVRVEYRAGVAPGNAIAITAPVTYENERLTTKMTGAAARTLVYPELYLYFPCRQLPALRGGIVEVPQYIVIGRTESPPLRYHVTSPFVGLLDLYALERVPVADTEEQVDRLRVFEVDRAIAGAVIAPPVSSTVVTSRA